MKRFLFPRGWCFGLALVALAPLAAQPELMQWGSLRGLRVDGQLLSVPLSLQVVRADGTVLARTAHYAQGSAYHRDGAVQRVQVKLGGLDCVTEVEETGAGRAQFRVTATPLEARADATGCLTLDLPTADYPGAELSWLDNSALALRGADLRQPARETATGVRVTAGTRTLEISTDAPIAIELNAGAEPGVLRLRFAVVAGPWTANQAVTRTFAIKASAAIDHSPVAVAVDAAHPGRRFDGVGGNFRLQFPASDPAIIDYKLAHLRVTWGRIAMWWRDWDADEAADPLAAARAGKVTDRIRNQIALARRLARAGMPVIVSAWDPPAWANLPGPRPPGAYTDPVNPAKWRRMAESIAAYLQFVKESVGVEAVLFSFNEPDLGLMQSASDHAAFVKLVGEACVARGLATKHLVADTSNGTLKSLRHAEAVLADPTCHQYAGAVGFHTWGGTEDENLAQWDAVARRLGVPLLVTEAGPDAEAHKHPDMFYEPAYALDEIELYVRVCAIAQPTTLMHWQLTADYSLLKGGGAYGRNGPLEITPRFLNYQQLADTPAGAFALPAHSDRRDVTAAAFGDIAGGKYAVHLVNTGASRTAVVTGLPAALRTLRVVATGTVTGRAPDTTVAVQDGRAEVPLVAAGLTSVYGVVEP